MRIGIGYDAHKLVKDRKLIIGGIEIEHEKGLLGHSDADVLIHAVIDALVGALGEGSIGQFFPDSDPQYKNISSVALLVKIASVLEEKDYAVGNIDSVVVCEEPKIAPHVPKMKVILAEALGIEHDRINIKGKTEEGMGFTGKKEGIAAYASAIIHRKVQK